MTIAELSEYLLNRQNIELTFEQGEKFARYLALLKEWSARFNLTAITEDSQIVEKHFLDSLLILKYSDFAAKSIIDVGSGAGFPGIPIAIVMPSLKITLLEPNKKKCSFLEAVKEALVLENVTIVEGRAETQVDFRERFDVAIARAVKPLNILVELVPPLLKVGGIFIAMKALNAQPEIDEAARALFLLRCRIIEVERDTLPTDGDVRVNIFIAKNAITPARFPRPYNIISAKPL